MPSVPETAWGNWGNPSPINAWSETEPAQLFGSTGGELKQGYADTLKWYYKRTSNPNDREHCLKLLTRLQIQKDQQLQSTRPQTAPRRFNAERKFQQRPIIKTNPVSKQQISFSANDQAEKNKDPKRTYQQQLAASQRLSRPKTVKCRFERNLSHSSQEARPKSAMASLDCRRVGDPYLTSYESDFPGHSTDKSAQATRPMTSKGAINPPQYQKSSLSTTFSENFEWKSAPKVDPIRSGTSSGNRNNNPHPQQGFMVWKLPRKNAEGQSGAPAKNQYYRELSDRMMNQIIVDKLKSTYQNDFMGIPQGYQVKDAIDCPSDWRDQVPKPSITTSRRTYNNSKQEPELIGNTTRYGCNKGKSISAVGIVPSVTKKHVTSQQAIKSTTTYSNFYEQRYRRPDLDKLHRQQDNQKLVNSFLRYARTRDADVHGEKNL